MSVLDGDGAAAHQCQIEFDALAQHLRRLRVGDDGVEPAPGILEEIGLERGNAEEFASRMAPEPGRRRQRLELLAQPGIRQDVDAQQAGAQAGEIAMVLVERGVVGDRVEGGRAGSRITLGGYTEAGDAQCLANEQFELGDVRSLDTVMRELVEDGYLPSFCTACYRKGRTGEHFMEFAIPGFIKRLCTPNALLTLKEYEVDYASPEVREKSRRLIADELARIE